MDEWVSRAVFTFGSSTGRHANAALTLSSVWPPSQPRSTRSATKVLWEATTNPGAGILDGINFITIRKTKLAQRTQPSSSRMRISPFQTRFTVRRLAGSWLLPSYVCHDVNFTTAISLTLFSIFLLKTKISFCFVCFVCRCRCCFVLFHQHNSRIGHG